MAKYNKSEYSLGEILSIALLAVFVFFIASLIIAVPVWLLWNGLVPVIFGVTKISLLLAWGISFLANLLFKPGSVSDK